MTKKLLYLVVALVLSVGLQSCKDDSEASFAASGTIKMKLDNTNWTANGSVGTVISAGPNTVFSATGAKVVNTSTNNVESISVSVVKVGEVTAGTYNIGNQVPYGHISFSDSENNQSVNYTAISGKVVITRASSGNFRGTFDGVLKNNSNNDEIVVTNGEFNVDVLSLGI
jgi:hypothetical protein